MVGKVLFCMVGLIDILEVISILWRCHQLDIFLGCKCMNCYETLLDPFYSLNQWSFIKISYFYWNEVVRLLNFNFKPWYISKRFAHTASVYMDWDENPFVHLETLLKMLFCAYAQTTGKGRKGPPRMVGLIDFLEMISILWRCDPLDIFLGCGVWNIM